MAFRFEILNIFLRKETYFPENSIALFSRFVKYGVAKNL